MVIVVPAQARSLFSPLRSAPAKSNAITGHGSGCRKWMGWKGENKRMTRHDQ